MLRLRYMAWFILCAPLPLAADLIVLKNGSSIATKGAWHATSTYVAYFDPATGKPNLIPVGFVDLDKSRAATVSGTPPEAPNRDKVAITDADVMNWDPAVFNALRSGDLVGALNATAVQRRAIRCDLIFDDEQARALCRIGREVPDYLPKAVMTPDRLKALNSLDRLDRAIECMSANRTEAGRTLCLGRLQAEP